MHCSAVQWLPHCHKWERRNRCITAFHICRKSCRVVGSLFLLGSYDYNHIGVKPATDHLLYVCHSCLYRYQLLCLQVLSPTVQGFDVATLYRAVNPKGDEPEWRGEVVGLKAELRAYQRRSLQWMISREMGSDSTVWVSVAWAAQCRWLSLLPCYIAIDVSVIDEWTPADTVTNSTACSVCLFQFLESLQKVIAQKCTNAPEWQS